MTNEIPVEVASLRPQSLLRLRTLTRLRWFAVCGQASVSALVVIAFGYQIPVIPLAIAIAAGLVANLYVLQRQAPTKVLNPNELAAHLVFDTIQIGVVLGLTGGIHNPFSVWLILPAMLAAFALDVRRAALVISVVTLVLSIVGLWHDVVPGGFTSPAIAYTFGTWVALMLGVTFTAAYARQVALAQSKLSTALEATQAVLAREERLTAVGGLAAAAAHELGTPLATIQVTAREMEQDLPDGPLKEDAQLLISQTQRCQRILTRLSRVGSAEDLRHAELTLEELLHEAARPFLDQPGPLVEIAFDPDSTFAPPERLQRQPAIIYGLRTLIENAVKFADTSLHIAAKWDEQTLTVLIDDDGPGFPADVLSRLGEPFARQFPTKSQDSRHGLGLGFFIAKTLLERTGATIRFGNGRRLRGAWVEISWPMSKLYVESRIDAKEEKESTGQ